MFSVLEPGFGESIIATNIISPTSMAFTPDGRLFVTEKTGNVRVIKNGSLRSTPFVTVNTSTFSERGLGGIAFHPDFQNSPYVYVYYTTPEPNAHNRLSRFLADGDVAVPGSEEVLLDLPSPGNGTAHNGGAMQFLPDGTLLLCVGDHTYNLEAQSMDSLFGKVLRLNPDGSIPADNPFYQTATGMSRAIWALGLRNPFTMDVQEGTGRVFINDVGNAAWEEINEGAAGANYGWVTTEGPFDPEEYPQFTNPLFAYDHSQGQAVTGGAFYNPPAVQFPPEFVGKYFYADFVSGWIRALDPQTKQITPLATRSDGIVDLDVGPDGSLYWLSRYNNAVFKIRATQAPSVSTHPQDQLVSVGGSATFSVVATGQLPLSFQWERDGEEIDGATAASYTLPTTTLDDDGAMFRCVITNGVGATMSDAATLSVTTDQPPVPIILTPLDGTTYGGGQNISFSGEGTDNEDGALPASALSWKVDFHHDAHAHPFIESFTGAGGSFEIPTLGETSANVWYRVHLSVTDSAGFTRSTYRDIQPRTSTITIEASHAGLGLAVDGIERAAPFTVTGVEGMQRVLSAAEFQAVAGLSYDFISWSNGGAATQLIVFPVDDTIYTASYLPFTDYWLSDREPTNSDGDLELDTNLAGETLRIDGQAHPRGLGVGTPSELVYELGGAFDRFRSTVGIDDAVFNGGSVVFQVWVDGIKRFDSGVLTGASPGVEVDVDVVGADELVLVVSDGGDGTFNDYADWGSARLVKLSHQAPDAPQDLWATSPLYNRVIVSWTDRSTNEASFLIERSVDGVNFTQVASVPAGTTSFIDTYLDGGTTYIYRARAANAVGQSPYSAAAQVTTAPATLPTPWEETVFGNIAPHLAGSVSHDAGTFIITGGGLGIGNEADAMHAVYRPLTGDGRITVRLTDFGDGQTFDIAQAGVFIRETLAPASKSISMLARAANSSMSLRRLVTGADSWVQAGPVLERPCWLRVERIGNTVTASASTDGVNFNVYTTDTVFMAQTVYVGMGVSSNNAFATATATFDQVVYESNAPFIVNPAAVAPNPVTGNTATLTALGDDNDGESNLTYTWSLVLKPEGAADPIFDEQVNGTNDGKSTTVTFARAGTYWLRVRVSDGTGFVDSGVTFYVQQTLAGVNLSPEQVALSHNATFQFIAEAVDQFGDAMATPQQLIWGVSQAGTISAGGLYTAPPDDATATVHVWAGPFSASSAVTVVGTAPTVVEPPSAMPDTVTATTTDLSVLGDCELGESALVYTWAVTAAPAGASVLFSANGTNDAKNSTATFNRAGNYTLAVTLYDGVHSAVAEVNVIVQPTPVALRLGSQQPAGPLALKPAATFVLPFIVEDQFGQPMTTPPQLVWEVTGSQNTISPAGELTAGLTEGSFTVSAAVAGTPVPGEINDHLDFIVDGTPPGASWNADVAPHPLDSVWYFSITYDDLSGVSVQSLGNDDVAVTAPDGTPFPAELVEIDDWSDGAPRVATYRLEIPGGTFGDFAAGDWTITLAADAVADLAGNLSAADPSLGVFQVNEVFASLDGTGALVVHGTLDPDQIDLSVADGQVLVARAGQTLAFGESGVNEIIVRGYLGDDTLAVSNVAVPVRYEAGGGADSLTAAAGTLTLAAGYDVGGDGSIISVTVADGAALAVSGEQHFDALALQGNAAAVCNSAMPVSYVVVTNELVLSPASRLDLGGQALIVHQGEVGEWSGGGYDGLSGRIASGHAGGSWNGNGIVSGLAAASGGLTGLGIGLAGAIVGFEEDTDTWRGHEVAADAVIITYCYIGDANLDGFISGDDYSAIDFAAGIADADGWNNGDFNFDGIISGDDYSAIDFNLIAQGPPIG